MNISVVLAHPQKRSFNHAIARRVVQVIRRLGHDVLFHDLYEEKFDPILSSREIKNSKYADKKTKKYWREIVQAERIIIIHPNWWGQPPAILKGWVDKVLRDDVAYKFVGNDKGEGVPLGLLKADKVFIFNTSNTEKEREKKVFKDPLSFIWENCIFRLCGVEKIYRKMYGVMVTSTAQERREWLDEIERILEKDL